MAEIDYRAFDAENARRRETLGNGTLTGRHWSNFADVAEHFKEEGLSTRASHSLAREGFEALSEAQYFTEQQFLRLPNFGRASLNSLKEALHRRGMFLRPKP